MGRGKDAARFPQGQGAPAENPRQGQDAQDSDGMRGVFSFGYFSFNMDAGA